MNLASSGSFFNFITSFYVLILIRVLLFWYAGMPTFTCSYWHYTNPLGKKKRKKKKERKKERQSMRWAEFWNSIMRTACNGWPFVTFFFFVMHMLPNEKGVKERPKHSVLYRFIETSQGRICSHKLWFKFQTYLLLHELWDLPLI